MQPWPHAIAIHGHNYDGLLGLPTWSPPTTHTPTSHSSMGGKPYATQSSPTASLGRFSAQAGGHPVQGGEHCAIASKDLAIMDVLPVTPGDLFVNLNGLSSTADGLLGMPSGPLARGKGFLVQRSNIQGSQEALGARLQPSAAQKQQAWGGER